MKNKILGVATTGLLGTLFAFAEDSNVQADRERISLFSVPLVCEAAPEIGCGSRSKPILLELQRQPEIAEAWVKAQGLAMKLAQIIQDRFISEARSSKLEVYEEVMKVVRENLDERGVAVFQEAIAKGYRPQAEDNEGTKTHKPSCCSAKAG
jgi:hypothetical protein